MPYAELNEIRRLMAQFQVLATSRPTDEQANTIINDTDAEVNVHLAAAGVLVPVATPAYFVDWLSLVVGYGSCAAILKSMFPGAIGPDETPAFAFWEARYRNALKGIDDGSLIPPVVPVGPATNEILPSTYFTRNPDGEEHLGDIAEPFFKRGSIF